MKKSWATDRRFAKREITVASVMSRIGVLSFVFAAAFGLASPLPTAKPVIVRSPDGKVKAELNAGGGTLHYVVTV